MPVPQELLSVVKLENFHKAALLELGKKLPADDAELANWIEDLAEKHNPNHYVYFVYSALMSERKLDASHLVLGLQFFAAEADVASVAFHLEGNVAEALLTSIRTVMTSPGRRAVGLLVAALWCKDKGLPIPSEVFSQARLLARHSWEREGVSTNIHSLALLTGDSVLNGIIRDHYPKANESGFGELQRRTNEYREILLTSAKRSSLELVPDTAPSPSRKLAEGTTMRRSVPRIGRNDPCPCGSGKKYKHCCIEKDEERLRHSSHVAGKTLEEVEQEPEPHLTLRQLEKMGAFEMARLDVTKVKRDLWEPYFVHLGGRNLFDLVVSGFQTLGYPEELLDAWATVLFWASFTGNKEGAEKVFALEAYRKRYTNEKRLFGTTLVLNRDNPAELLRIMEQRASLLKDETDEDTLKTFAMWLIRSSNLPWLGVFVARGVMSLVSDENASSLLTHIIELRDKENLPPDDPISEYLDQRLLKKRERDEDADAAALRKAQRNLEKKREEIRQMKERLSSLQRDLHLRERRSKADQNPQTAPAQVDDSALKDLRQKVETLKGELNNQHAERNDLRRDLQKAQEELTELRHSTTTTKEENNGINEDDLLLSDEPIAIQPVRTIEFPKKFRETLKSVPRNIARSTMSMLGRIGGGEPAAFVGAVRLKACPDITRQRIGSDYRLLFKLLPDTVEVVDLINRKDLERRIKTLAG